MERGCEGGCGGYEQIFTIQDRTGAPEEDIHECLNMLVLGLVELAIGQGSPDPAFEYASTWPGGICKANLVRAAPTEPIQNCIFSLCADRACKLYTDCKSAQWSWSFEAPDKESLFTQLSKIPYVQLDRGWTGESLLF